MSNKYPLPYDTQAENYAIGAALLNESDLDLLLELTSSKDFFKPENIKIMDALLSMSVANKKFNTRTLGDYLNDNEALQHAMQCRFISSGVDIRHYAGIVREHSRRRTLIISAQELLRRCGKKEFETEQLVEEFEDTLYNLSESKQSIRITPLSQVGDSFHGERFEDWLVARKEKADRGEMIIDGPTTGYPGLDAKIGGLAPTRNIVMGAGTGIGKTEMICQILARTIDNNVPVLFFSYEMNREELYTRVTGILAQVFHGRMQKGKISTDEMHQILRRHQEIQEKANHLHVVDLSSPTTDQIRAIVRRYKQRYRVRLVVIDHMLLVPPVKDMMGNSRYEYVSYNSRQMKVIASEFEVCMLVATQLNRNIAMHDRPRKPRMSDLRDSGNIEQDANQVILVHREKDAQGNDLDNRVHMLVVKNRHGDTGEVTFIYDRHTQSLEELDRDVGDEIQQIVNTPAT